MWLLRLWKISTSIPVIAKKYLSFDLLFLDSIKEKTFTTKVYILSWYKIKRSDDNIIFFFFLMKFEKKLV